MWPPPETTMEESGIRASASTVRVGTPLATSRICRRASPPFAVNHRSTPASWVALSSTKVWASGSTQMVVMVFTCRRVLTVSCPCPTKTAEAREPPLPVKVTALAPEGTLAGMRNEPSSVPLPSAVP